MNPAPFDKTNGDKTKILQIISAQLDKRCGVNTDKNKSQIQNRKFQISTKTNFSLTGLTGFSLYPRNPVGKDSDFSLTGLTGFSLYPRNPVGKDSDSNNQKSKYKKVLNFNLWKFEFIWDLVLWIWSLIYSYLCISVAKNY